MAEKIYLNAIEGAERELQKLQKDHADLLKKIESLELFIQSGLALTGQERQPTSLFPSPQPASGVATPGGAIADHVAEIIKNAGRPLHVKEIVRRLRTVRSLNGKNPTASIVVAIKRRGNQFRKVKPNTFELAENP